MNLEVFRKWVLCDFLRFGILSSTRKGNNKLINSISQYWG